MSVSAVNFCDGTIWMTSPARIASLQARTISVNSAFVISLVNAPTWCAVRAPRRSMYRAMESAVRRRW